MVDVPLDGNRSALFKSKRRAYRVSERESRVASVSEGLGMRSTQCL